MGRRSERKGPFCYGIAKHSFVGPSKRNFIYTLAGNSLFFNHLTGISAVFETIREPDFLKLYFSDSAGYVNPACPSEGNIPFFEVGPR
jgi:hypothetical protein